MATFIKQCVVMCCLFLLSLLSHVHCLRLHKSIHMFDLSDRLVPYNTAWRWQNALVEKHIDMQSKQALYQQDQCVGSLLILQHNSVYTLGSGTQSDSGPFSKQCSLGAPLEYETVTVDRAGQATYHGPGQVVMYPIIDLVCYAQYKQSSCLCLIATSVFICQTHFEQDIHLYLRRLEQVVIDTLGSFGITAGRIDGATGVWVTDSQAVGSNPGDISSNVVLPCKIAALGIKLRRWVTMHGLSLNVDPDMRYFRNIVPCGIADKAVGSVAQFRPQVTTAQVSSELLRRFGGLFDVELGPVLSGDEAKQKLDELYDRNTKV